MFVWGEVGVGNEVVIIIHNRKLVSRTSSAQQEEREETKSFSRTNKYNRGIFAKESLDTGRLSKFPESLGKGGGRAYAKME